MWGLLWSTAHRPALPPVHPHTCGVYADDVQAAGLLVWFIPTHVGFTVEWHKSEAGKAGSSPHMWGLLSRISAPVRSSTVHPHTCGVYLIFIAHLCSLFGSSPHMWGLLSFCPGNRATCPVHPHTCGVYVWHCYFRNRDRGSSPHMWGLLMTREL